MAKCATTVLRLTSDQIDAPRETSCGQVCYYLSQVDHWSDGPPAPLERHLVARCVTTVLRLTPGQMYPPGRDICGKVVLLPQSG